MSLGESTSAFAEKPVTTDPVRCTYLGWLAPLSRPMANVTPHDLGRSPGSSQVRAKVQRHFGIVCGRRCVL